MEPFLREGYLQRLVPDMRQSLKEQLYNDCDGFTFTPVTPDPGVSWIDVTQGRLRATINVIPHILTRKEVVRFSKDIWSKDFSILQLTNNTKLEYDDGSPFSVMVLDLYSSITIPSLPLCRQLIDALLAVAS